MDTLQSTYFKKSDFDPKHPDWSRNGHKIIGSRTTTLYVYFRCMDKDSQAGKYIDEGYTPYIMNRAAYENGMWPWVEIEDVDRGMMIDGEIGVYHSCGHTTLPPDTLIFWR